MLKLNKKLLSYALDFVSFFLERIDKNKIDKIILFGSAAREEAGKESDIDLFIETKISIKGSLDKTKSAFFSSTKYKNYWELKGINNDIKVMTGELDKWSE